MTTRRTNRRGRARALALALMCVLVALPAGSGAAPASRVAPPEGAAAPKATPGYYVGTFNIYGNVGHRGDAGDWIKDEADAIMRLTLGDPDRWLFIGLQEVCKAQGERFARELGMRSAFVDTGTDCADGQPFGNSVLFHSAAQLLPPALLPNPDGRNGERGIICAVIRAPGHPVLPGSQVTACSTHLTVGATKSREREEQAEFIRHGWKPDGTHILGADGPVVLAGDLNATPEAGELDDLYDATEASGPRETGPPYLHPTYGDGRKIDYLLTWGVRGSARWRDTGVRWTASSDHGFYYGELSIGAG
ncbi:endonuclease/exonuclease/phosphatase family protein [Streptomyces sp. NBC_00878]|uniref:endonuclease/exonuclease/phosphatase family protein n=1 Tax=Streptomyces sp. NBC_00878 TaxID=2975854 RepID=UPI00224ED637|nr:endonuclease/exonuclease/phosphatase family protein [Streptomyces sp. NBC_00878]MCX4911365.1 endonuclease/exonuclease/phosphatase family protein [Streptomyces sp. NBC_00878]